MTAITEPVIRASQQTFGGHHNGHSHCIACGASNALSLGLTFRNIGNGRVEGDIKPHRALQGYRGILHGGIISMMLDAAMTHCLFHHNITAVTADLHIRFLVSVPCDQNIRLCAWITSSKSPLYRLKSELHVSGQLMAYAEAKFLRK
ncbi:PaaI family thioesterase [Teredinibacter haidensis]|uniref:PaaI family thioesterase n=1 Tax=Teredinibacter haidensis TaxID=2731755 RepID=UPI0009FA6483|nr:PaaI family thioesterase [Teredinibacter haidensis]